MNGQAGIDKNRLHRWQALTITLMCTGYSGYYFCRSNFSVCLPQIISYLVAHGMNAAEAKVRLGTVSSAGVLAYAIGKLLLGGTADWLGGRRNFLLGMMGAVIFTMLFAQNGVLPLFALCWVGNRLVQSLGWAGMVKVTSKWFSYSAYGAVMGAISLSYLFGDAVARHLLSVLIGQGLGWKGVFYVSAGILLGLFVMNFFLLKESRAELGFTEPEVNPTNLFHETAKAGARAGLRRVLLPLVSSPVFWLVSVLSFGCTLVRETFNTWIPTFFNQAIGFSPERAGDLSALFPLFGGFSVLLFGYLSDLLSGARAKIMFLGLLLSTLALLTLAYSATAASAGLTVVMVTLVGFLMMGPYSYLGGAMALDLGGREGCATASGIIDGIGYLGGVLSGEMMARISVSYGWHEVLLVLTVASALACLAAALLCFRQ